MNSMYETVPGQDDATGLGNPAVAERASGFSNQLDPLNTAGQQDPFGAGAAHVGQQAAPRAAAKSLGGAKPAKKKLSLGKKVAYGVGGVIGVLAVAVILIDSTGPQQHVNPHPVPPAGRPPAPAQPGLVAGASADPSTTLMSGGPANPSAAAAEAGNGQIQPAPAAASATASSVAPSAAAPAASKPEPAAAKGAVVSAPAPAHKEPAAPAPSSAVAAPASDTEKVLAARLARLERRLAQVEHVQAHPRIVKVDRTPVVRPQSAVAVVQPAVAVSAAPAPSKQRVLTNDEVRVIGVFTRQGVREALLEFGGVKHRVAVGEQVTGLGPVSSIAVDASGAPVVQINGFTYH